MLALHIQHFRNPYAWLQNSRLVEIFRACMHMLPLTLNRQTCI